MPEIFHIVPATSRSPWLFIPLMAVLIAVVVGVGAVVAFTMRGAQSSTFELSESGLRLRGDMYGRLIPASALRGGAARIVDLDVERTLRPTVKTIGTGLPSYKAGWFRLADGEKALLYLTDTHRVVYVPTRAGYSVLLSVDRPEAFVERLRAIAPGS